MNLHTRFELTKMATRTGEKEVSGEDLDAILELLDSDFLAEEMISSLDKATEEVNSDLFILWL